MMKTIVLVALLAAAGCSKKGSDCEASIGKGMDNFTAKIKSGASNPQMQESMMGVIGKLKGALVQRCTEDKWPQEVVTCFNTVASMKDMKTCQQKLSPEQQSKLRTDITQIMLGSGRMPGNVPGHPPMLSGSDSAAPPPGGAGAPAGAGTPPAGAGTPPAGTNATPPAGSTAAPAGSTTAPPAGSTAKPAGSTTPAAGSAAAPAGGW